jgi:hypothetical protein
MSSLIYNWTNELTLYTNGEASLSEQLNVVQEEVERLEHKNGYVQYLL